MNDRHRKCTICGKLITIPPYGLGLCSIHEDGPHQQKDYCPDWKALRKEDAYCSPRCKQNGIKITERDPATIANSPISKPLKEWPIGTALITELDADEATPGAPIYFIVARDEIVKLDPKTRSRTQCDLPSMVRMCEVAL